MFGGQGTGTLFLLVEPNSLSGTPCQNVRVIFSCKKKTRGVGVEGKGG